MVNLADGCVLAQESAITTLDLGDVADDDRRTDMPAARLENQGSQQNGRPARLDLHTATGLVRQRISDVSRSFLRLERVGDQRTGQRREVLAHQIRTQTHPVIGRERVRAGIDDGAFGIETDEAVARTWARVRVGARFPDREGSVADHLTQVFGAIEIRELERTLRSLVRQVGVAAQNRDDSPVQTHRNGFPTRRHSFTPRLVFPAHDAALDESAKNLRVLGLGNDRSDCVLRKSRRCRCRPAMRDADDRPLGSVLLRFGAHPQENVGKGEVGEQLPLPHDALEMVDRRTGKIGVFGEEVTESGHRPA